MSLPKGGYAPVNGLKMYYEIHGTGRPLVLLHGGFGVIGYSLEFEQLLPTLAKTQQVIAVELQAHGHTTDIDRPLRLLHSPYHKRLREWREASRG